MANGRIHVVWTWLDEEDRPVYVGWGKFTKTHPAKTLWARRHVVNSELCRWLRSLKREPNRYERTSSIIPLSGPEARAIAKARTEKLKAAGFRLLDSRVDETRIGGGSGRPVIDPNLEMFQSVREAAAHYGVNPSTITRWCQTDDTQWNFAFKP